ncbi:MAG: carbon-nitrogen hydrolase family protein [Phycisphaerales bacterium]|nr:carbon-nitrogen hydrolase family protein [Phycisphaerales bacterium]
MNNKDYPTFAAKLEEAVRWVDFAARQGARLVVLPESLNLYFGDGDVDHMPSLAEAALDDWQLQTRPLIESAIRNQVAITVPVIAHKEGRLLNCFYLVDKNGNVLGRYDKQCPTHEELDAGMVPGNSPLIEWEGIKIGGAICFDCYFPEVFSRQADAGAQIFLMPSLTPGGDHLNYAALKNSTPIVLAYPAYSRIIDLDGRELAGGGYRNETLRFGFGSPVILASINFDRVVLYANHNQEKIVEMQQTYGAKIAVRFDQPNCLFIVESRSPDLTMQEVIKRFNLIDQRRYFNQYACRKESICK